MSSPSIENASLTASLEREMQNADGSSSHRGAILPLLKDTFVSSAKAVNGFVDFVMDAQAAVVQSHKENPSPSM
jgi:hypothetical protein